MSGKKARAARKAAALEASKKRSQSSSAFWRSWKGSLVGVAVVAVIGASFVVPKLVNGGSTSAATSHSGEAMGLDRGKGLDVGARVPAFSETNVETGRPISSRSLYGHRTLLFFSEGVMCQACFEQIRGLEQVGTQLAKRGIQLVSITPDSPTELKQAISQYGITSPMISDDNRDMSEAFNTLGLGMHADTPGHAFALIYHGKVAWYRDYWLPPDRTMYVAPEQLLTAIPLA